MEPPGRSRADSKRSPLVPTLLRDLVLKEISLVDRPANEGARITIFKRDASSDSNGVDPAGRKAGIQKKGEEMPDDNKKVTDLEEEVKSLKAKLAEYQKRAEDAEAKVTEVTKAKDAAANDEVVKIDDKTEVRKSVVGDATFAVIKAQQAQIAHERSARELVEVAKRAETEFGNFPGEAIAKAKALVSLAALPEEPRKTLEEMLKAGNAALGKSFTSIGSSGHSPSFGGSADEQLDNLAKAKAKEENIDFHKAYDAVLASPEGKRLYNESLGDARARARAN